MTGEDEPSFLCSSCWTELTYAGVGWTLCLGCSYAIYPTTHFDGTTRLCTIALAFGIVRRNNPGLSFLRVESEPTPKTVDGADQDGSAAGNFDRAGDS